jgi:hypothetical protein
MRNIERLGKAIGLLRQANDRVPTRSALALALLWAPHFSYGQGVDLAITNAHVLNVRTGRISTPQTILIRQGRIVAIQRPARAYVAAQTLDAHGRLVTPACQSTPLY